MRHIQHPSNNWVLGAPAGWDQKELPVNALPVTHSTADGVPCVVSFWMPNAAELAALNAGHPVVLSILGETMPPVSLLVEA